MRKAILLPMCLVATPLSLADEPAEIDARLVETYNAGVMMGLEAAGVDRLIANCVWRIYLTETPEAAEVVGVEANEMPKNIQEWRWTLEFNQKSLPGWVEKCRDLM
jgi:hypothetical protein